MARDIGDDAYIAELLKQDAKKATKTYELVGIDAFNSRRMNSRAPRPNKNFLQHLIRQTDSHNTALLAKEAEESRARLRKMNREQKRTREQEEDKGESAERRLTPVASANNARDATPRRRDRSEDRNKHRRRRGERELDDSTSASSRRYRDRSRDGHRHKSRHDSEEEERSRQKRRRSRSPRDKSHKDKYKEEQERWKPRKRDHKDRRQRRHRSHSRTTSRSRSRSPHSDKHGESRKYRDRTRSRSPKQKHVASNPHKDGRRSNRRTASPASDSDPLEAIVGPLPPPPEPTIRPRGRGAYKANNMGIESRFSSTYDPSTDVRANSDVEDDWGDALEALRDRARWQQQGADRLKAAGLTVEQVKKWEKGDVQNEEDVVWSTKGHAREWDRGKVLDEDGDVELKADFGRLK